MIDISAAATLQPLPSMTTPDETRPDDFAAVADAQSRALSRTVCLSGAVLTVAHPMGLFAMAATFSVYVGHVYYRQSREAYGLRRALDGKRAELADANLRLEARVEEQTRDLRRLATRLDDVIETERRRFASNLQDDLVQELTAMRLDVETLAAVARDEPAASRVERVAAGINHSHRSVRLILESMRPRILDEEGLESAIHWLGRHLRERTACAVEVVVDLVAFRVAQESLNNVTRHARATSVSVSLRRRGDELVLDVADDGATDDQGPIRPGRGVAGMRERVSSLGGELSVTAAPTRGTLVRATIPLGATAAAAN